jgi:uncharacterized protein
MVTRDIPWPEGTPCWVDLGVDDVAKASAFYAGLFGWDLHRGTEDVGYYTLCSKNGWPVAGIGPRQGPPGTPVAWNTYIACLNANDTADRIAAAGGKILMAPTDVLDVGRMAMAFDPAGAAFGVWEAHAHNGIGLANEPGSLCWNENLSRSFDANKSFYNSVFGYNYGDIPDAGFRYSTLKVGGTEVGGIGELGESFPNEIPSHWSVYFAVEDTDATVEQVTASGGAPVREPWDTPYGRMAVVTDYQGAIFSLISIAPRDDG